MKKLSIISSVILLVACNSAPETKVAPAFDLAPVKAEIISTNQQFEQAFIKGDSTAIAALYMADAKIYPPNMKACNRNGVGSMTAGVPKMGIKTMKLKTEEVSGGPDEVLETGDYEMGDGTKTIDEGNYMVIWKKEGDKWKMFRDMWNSSNMPPPTK